MTLWLSLRLCLLQSAWKTKLELQKETWFINDPLSQSHRYASSQPYFQYFLFVRFVCLFVRDELTQNICENTVKLPTVTVGRPSWIKKQGEGSDMRLKRIIIRTGGGDTKRLKLERRNPLLLKNRIPFVWRNGICPGAFVFPLISFSHKTFLALQEF